MVLGVSVPGQIPKARKNILPAPENHRRMLAEASQSKSGNQEIAERRQSVSVSSTSGECD